ncbi:cell division protein SepF 3 [Streptomyces mashuensis]|uniref:Cell division protein SepF n=1 Tax=Streptomyces mashuensis TaxID=33904 RepID=A0A919E8Y7_9ACTN|nr:cell division protein SepF [Streptomyces mashuensis]GHF24757.1 cell division protein SepF 3 [Streptomyces mashuensis]
MNRSEAADTHWKGLADVVPLRGHQDWPSWSDHRALPAEEPQDDGRQRLVVLRAQFFEDARQVAENLAAQTPVLLDLTSAEPEVAKRILDFSSGVVFGLGCAMHRVDSNVFLLAPDGTEVSAAYPDRRKNDQLKRFG